MKTIHVKDSSGMTVGQIIDGMHLTGDFAPLGREDIFAVVEIFLKEYVGMPGALITKKFTQESAADIANRLSVPLEQVVKIVTVFRIKARPPTTNQMTFVKSYLKPRVVKGERGFIRRM